MSARRIVDGQGIGDALDRVTEFLSLRHIKSAYGEDGITDLPEPALFTDDTQMSIAIAKAFKVRDFQAFMASQRDNNTSLPRELVS